MAIAGLGGEHDIPGAVIASRRPNDPGPSGVGGARRGDRGENGRDNIHRRARMPLKSAKKAIGRADMVIFFLFLGYAAAGVR
jgi:hypothetical protein